MTSAICVTALDYVRLQACIRVEFGGNVHSTNAHVAELVYRLENARVIMDTLSIPQDLVTMRTALHLHNIDTGKVLDCVLAYPDEVNNDAHKVSVTSPLGIALLGRRTGDLIVVQANEGRSRYRVGDIVYQPESARHSQR